MKIFWKGIPVPVTGAGENVISYLVDGYGTNPGRPDSEPPADDLSKMRTQVLSQEDV